MNAKHFLIALALIAGPFAGAFVFSKLRSSTPASPAQLNLEEILSIRELHLVKHTYNDLFFLHRKNDVTKPVRAIVQVPVSITSYINLKDIGIVKVNDTIRKIILPNGCIDNPSYAIDRMHVTRTKSFQLHAGADLYPEVSQYLKETINTRKDSVKRLALRNHIVEQAEAEGKEYIESLLVAVGRKDIIVTFADPSKNQRIAAYQRHARLHAKTIQQHPSSDSSRHYIDYLAQYIIER